MQSVQSSVRNALLRIEAARNFTGDSRCGFYTKMTQGLMVRPVKIGARAAAIPVRELESINAARIRGASADDIRALVTKLHAERAQAGQ